MDAALGWVGKLFEFIGALFPRLLVVEATDAGVAFVRGKHTKELRPGLHVYWPFWTEVVLVPVVRQTLALTGKTLTTADGREVVAGGMVRYKIRNVLKALSETHDIDSAVEDESTAVLCEYITSQTFANIQTGRSAVNTELTKRLRDVLSAYGVTVILAQLTDFAPCTTLVHVGIRNTIQEQG